MTEVIHIRCNRCELDVISDTGFSLMRGWTHCQIDLDKLDFCPSCWKEIMKSAKLEKES
jgi:hypothetical protein